MPARARVASCLLVWRRLRASDSSVSALPLPTSPTINPFAINLCFADCTINRLLPNDGAVGLTNRFQIILFVRFERMSLLRCDFGFVLLADRCLMTVFCFICSEQSVWRHLSYSLMTEYLREYYFSFNLSQKVRCINYSNIAYIYMNDEKWGYK